VNITDMDDKIIFVNDSFLRTYGYSKDELIGRTIDLIRSPNNPLKVVKQILPSTLKGRWDGELLNVKKDGSEFPINLSTSIIHDDNSKPVALIGVSMDITERKQWEDALKESEEKFRLLITNIRDVVYSVDMETKEFKYLSPSFEIITGYSLTDIKEMGGRQEFLSKVVTKAKFIEQDNYLLELKKGQYNSDYKHESWWLCKDGSFKFLQDHWIPIYSNDKLVSTDGILFDITDRKLAEDKLKENEAILKELNTDKDRFISILAHDLKSPFSSLLGFSSLLADNIHKYDLPKIEKFVNLIHNATKNTYDLLEDILLWARSHSGKIPYEPKEFKIKDVFKDLLEIVNPIAKAKNITINPVSENGLVVWGDLNMLKTILRNLTTNAIKFTNNGGCIEITAKNTFSDLTLSVSDNGIGMSNEVQRKLFDFSQINTTSGTENEKGTGFGLIICKEFVEKHGGKIWVESTIGKGTTFFLTIPQKNDSLLK